MKLLLNNGTLKTIKPNTITHSIALGNKLIKGTGTHIFSIDRGVTTDAYSIEIVFRKDADTISDLIQSFVDLRNNVKMVVFSDFDFNFLGDHIDYSQNRLEFMFEEEGFGIEETPVFNVMQFTVRLLAVKPPLLGDSYLPQLKCLQNNWSGSAKWKDVVNRTYGGEIHSVNHGNSSAVFKGQYILDVETNEKLHRYWVHNRSKVFNTTSQWFGATKMFGVEYGDSHSVIIENIESEFLSPRLRQVDISILRIGDSV